MKKIFLAISVIIFLFFANMLVDVKYNVNIWEIISNKTDKVIYQIINWDFISTNCSRETDPACQKCVEKGGKIIYHSFGVNCEKKAGDAGKECVYDNECDKNLCIYQYGRQSQDGNGHCIDYINEEGIKCHRKKGNDVSCDVGGIS